MIPDERSYERTPESRLSGPVRAAVALITAVALAIAGGSVVVNIDSISIGGDSPASPREESGDCHGASERTAEPRSESDVTGDLR